MHNHAHVRHPKEVVQEAKDRRRREHKLLYYNDLVLEWITNHVLASVILFDIALIVPLLTLDAPDTVKITLGVFLAVGFSGGLCRRYNAAKTRPRPKMKPRPKLTTRRSLTLPNCRTNR